MLVRWHCFCLFWFALVLFVVLCVWFVLSCGRLLVEVLIATWVCCDLRVCICYLLILLMLAFGTPIWCILLFVFSVVLFGNCYVVLLWCLLFMFDFMFSCAACLLCWPLLWLILCPPHLLGLTASSCRITCLLFWYLLFTDCACVLIWLGVCTYSPDLLCYCFSCYLWLSIYVVLI